MGGFTVECRTPDGRLKATAPQARAEKIRRAAQERYRTAPTGLARFVVAVDYARSAIAAAGRGGLDTNAVLEAATRYLWGVGDTVTADLAGRGSST